MGNIWALFFIPVGDYPQLGVDLQPKKTGEEEEEEEGEKVKEKGRDGCNALTCSGWSVPGHRLDSPALQIWMTMTGLGQLHHLNGKRKCKKVHKYG